MERIGDVKKLSRMGLRNLRIQRQWACSRQLSTLLRHWCSIITIIIITRVASSLFFLVGQTPFPTHLRYFFLLFLFEPFPFAPFELLLFSDRPLSDVPDHARSWVAPAHQHHRLPRQEVCNQFSNQAKLNLPGFSWQSQRKAELQLTWATIQCLTQSQHSGLPKLSQKCAHLHFLQYLFQKCQWQKRSF